jgi:chromosome segregation ATPase
MNQPTREEFEELKEEVRKLREQITEPIKINHLEIDRGGTQDLLKEANKKLDSIIQAQADRSERFDDFERGLRGISKKQDEQLAEIKSLSARQNEYDKGLISHSRSISVLQDEMKGAREDLKAMATKEDLKNLADTIEERVKDLLIKYLQPGGNGH